MHRMALALFLGLFVVTCHPAHAAIGATAVWEVEQNATTNDANGGGFDLGLGSCGTDFSKQPTAQFSFTDLASSTGTTTCVVTSASHNFTSTDNCNAVRIPSGTNWTPGWYFIKSTAGNAATLDRACGTAASLTGGTWSEGGAISLGNSNDSTWAAQLVPGNTVWVKAGSYTITVSIFITDCTNAHPCALTAYNSTRGDNPVGANRPTWNLQATEFDPGSLNVISNFIFTGTATISVTSDGQNVWYNNKFINTSTSSGHIAVAPGTDDLFINNEFISQAGLGLSESGDLTAVGNYFHDSPTCFKESSTGATAIAVFNTFAGCMTSAIQFSAAETSMGLLYGNSIYGGNVTGTGLLVASGASNVRPVSNIFNALATGISAAASTANWSAANSFSGNTTDRTNWSAGGTDTTCAPTFGNVAVVSGTAGTVSSATLTDNAANFSGVTDNTDYLDIISGTGVTVTPGSLLITSHTTHSVTVAAAIGGSGTNIAYNVITGHNFAIGLPCKRQGFPGLFPGGLFTGYTDTGAVQRREYGRKSQR